MRFDALVFFGASGDLADKKIRMQREPVERRGQRLAVGESLRLEGREAAHPLRPGRRRLAKDRRSREVPFGVALPVRLALVLEGPELAAPA
ncbi:MAG TPA: hypothetical protein VMR21_01725, partial [Vicinamibacteria bacterium]|nr:hypothetical protein [Vicinamibacteria bacterium]